MKKWLLCMLTLAMLMMATSALAVQITVDEYTNAPGNPTHENVNDIDAAVLQPDGALQPYELEFMLPTGLTVDTLGEIFDFVDVDQRPVVHYFPEDVQQEIEDILLFSGVAPEALFMSEFMSLDTPDFTQELLLEADVHLDIEYIPGRLVVVVLGWMTEEGLEWRALEADVMVMNTVSFDVPADLVPILADREILFSVLTIKTGPGESTITEYTYVEEFVPSVSSGDMTVVTETTVIDDGEPTDCQIVLVEPTELLRTEIVRMEEHIISRKLPAMAFFTTEVNRHVKLLLHHEFMLSELIPYELICVQVENYTEPYGDVVAKMNFITPYADGQTVSVLLGLPNEAEEVVWNVLHAEVKEGAVEITFSSAVLTIMMTEPALMVVMSTPVAQ